MSASIRVSGIDFAQFAGNSDAIWLELVGSSLAHTTFGIGKITQVGPRTNGPPLIDIAFEAVGNKTFIPAGFIADVITELDIPDDIAGLFVEWATERERIRIKKEAEDREEAAKLAKRLEEENMRSAAIAEIRSKYAPLAKKYNIPMSQVSDSPILRVLDNLEASCKIAQEDIKWLEANELWNVLATYEYRIYKSKGDPWDLIRACSHLRKAGLPEKVLSLTAPLVNAPGGPRGKALSGLLTTRGGAFRDLGQFEQAKDHGLRAIKAFDSQYPHFLLGALYYIEGNPELGDRHFELAALHGASARTRDHEIRSILQEANQDVRHKIAKYLLQKNEDQYKWVLPYMR